MTEIIWTEEAANWLKEIWDYIAQDSPSGAAKVVSGIYERVQLLKSFPELGHKYKTVSEVNAALPRRANVAVIKVICHGRNK